MSPEVLEYFRLCLEVCVFRMRFWPPAAVPEPEDPRRADDLSIIRDFVEGGHRRDLDAEIRAVVGTLFRLSERSHDKPDCALILNQMRTLLKSIQAVEARAPLDDVRREVIGSALVSERAAANGQLGSANRKACADERNEKIFDLACKLRHEDPTMSNTALVKAIFDQLRIAGTGKTIENLLSTAEGKKRVPARVRNTSGKSLP